jgi:hypothetical protein
MFGVLFLGMLALLVFRRDVKYKATSARISMTLRKNLSSYKWQVSLIILNLFFRCDIYCDTHGVIIDALELIQVQFPNSNSNIPNFSNYAKYHL